MSCNKTAQNITRRHFVTGAAAAFATLPTGARRAAAQGMPLLTADDPTAVALKYVPNAADAAPALRGGDDRFCSTCALYGGAPDSENAPCSIFPGKRVSASGWCSVWAPKQGS